MHRSRHATASLFLAGLVCVAGHAQAQDATQAGVQDPELVISRTVQPRIAYRGLPGVKPCR